VVVIVGSCTHDLCDVIEHSGVVVSLCAMRENCSLRGCPFGLTSKHPGSYRRERTVLTFYARLRIGDAGKLVL
jgi:glutamate synthase domain-containing protein 2